MSTTAIQKPKTNNDFLSLLQSEQTGVQLQKILPPCLTVERFRRVVRTAWLINNDLQNLEPASIMLAVMGLATLGLEPDRRKAYLIPFKGKAVGMPGYLGYIQRAEENGVSAIAFDIICFNDQFTPPTRTQDGLTFSHTIDPRKERGEMFAAYCSWKYKGENHIVLMSKLEIDKIRDGSPGKDQDPWRKHYNEMAKKTTIRRAQKQWPLDVKMQEAVATGKIIDSAIVDVASEIVTEAPEQAVESADDSNPELNPATPLAQGVAEAYKQIIAAEVPFDMFTAEMGARNISSQADSWPDFDSVPAAVWETLSSQPKTLAAIIKKHGKK